MNSLCEKNTEPDVVELCTIMQCLGFNIRSMDTSGVNVSQDGGNRTVVINCHVTIKKLDTSPEGDYLPLNEALMSQSSGLHMVLESAGASCSCPVADQEGGSGFWEICAVSGGHHHDKEFGSSLLGNFHRNFREHLSNELHEIVRSIRQHKEEQKAKDESCKLEQEIANKSASMVELQTTPEHRLQVKTDTPTRYRSLDALTRNNSEFELPPPRPLSKRDRPDEQGQIQGTYILPRRQSTYTLASTSGSGRKRNKTSSPIQASSKNNVLDRLVSAQKCAEELWNQLSGLVTDISQDAKDDSSVSSLALDVSKISLFKGPQNQFSSSPNLSGMSAFNDEGLLARTKLGRLDSASTSKLMVKKPTLTKDGAAPKSRLRKLSPSFFRKSSPRVSESSAHRPESGSGMLSNILLRAKIAKPVKIPKPSVSQASFQLSANKKKFSHIKSTIPKPTTKKT